MSGLRHPVFARLYALGSRAMDKKGSAEHRRELLEGLAGRVIEVGAGNGLNFSHYPPEVSEVLAVEPEPYLRRRSEEEARHAPVPVRIVDGVVDDLPASDGEFDAAVSSLLLCSVPDQGRALAEIRRVVRPSGELRFYEHVRGERTRARVQDALDVVFPRLAGGCHLNRETAAAIERAGFVIERVRHFEFASWPVAPHILGRARRP